MDTFTWDKWILLAAFLLDFFSKLSGKHFIDQTLQMYRLISPYCLCILPGFSNSGDTQISMYTHVPFGHAVFIKNHFGTSRVISDLASMYMCSLVSVFGSRLISVKQLTFEIHIILGQYSYHSFIQGSKNKTKFGEINISDCNFLSSSYGNEFQKSVGYAKYTTLNMVLFLQLIA